MIYREITINGQQIKLIPLGDCACGCGKKTTIPWRTDTRRNRTKGVPMKYLPGHNSKNSNHPNWKGGRYIGRRGQPVIHLPGHLRASRNHVREHIILAEKALGKPLPEKAQIHHHTIEQLVICQDQGYHSLLHQRSRALKACGNANWRKCRFCKQYDDQKNLLKSGTSHYHRQCNIDYCKNRRESR